MKLNEYIQEIARAYDALMQDIVLRSSRHEYSFDYQPRRPRHILPRQRQFLTPPKLPTQYDPTIISQSTDFQNKERLVLLAAFQASYPDTTTPMTPGMVPLILDTGASITISPFKSDFVSKIRPVQKVKIQGIASGLDVEGMGDISYSFYNDDGQLQTLYLTKCLYVPKCSVHLLCPRQIGATTNNPADGFNACSDNPILTVDGKQTTVQYDSLSKLPVLFTASGISSYQRYLGNLTEIKADPATHSNLLNLTKKQKQKLYLHECCAHEGFANLNSWIRQRKFPLIDPSLANEPDPLCTICQFGKARRKTHNAHNGHISSGHTVPGTGVSSDGMEAGLPGRIFSTKGLPSTKKYKFVSFWVDHMSKFVYATFHASKAAEELVASKTEFEGWAARFNIKITNIRADNGVYSAKLFKDACDKQQQSLTFCGVGAHWQNGIAERFIGTITERAHTILLHAMAKWPDVIKEDMWPFAIRHAIQFHNSSIRKGCHDPPYKLFTGEDPPCSIHDFRTSGCPTYVLHKSLQDGNAISKWKERAWRGVYIGPSTCHSNNVPLIYNPETTHVSPPYMTNLSQLPQAALT
jgi:hypothetical protein